jgi:hypothetical protein
MPTEWGPGYSQSELDAAQERFGLVFPPDLVALLMERRIPNGHDWTGDEAPIRRVLEWPLEGLLFDVEYNGLWWPEWGERPKSEAERAEIVTIIVASAPKLIPIYSHRYIPEEPNEAGNPVFSVHQSDIILYGTNLANYLEREFRNHRHRLEPGIGGGKRIRFWSETVERNGQPGFYQDPPQPPLASPGEGS